MNVTTSIIYIPLTIFTFINQLYYLEKALLIILLLLNIVVLIGQLWPEGAPPFARTVNIIFLILSLLYFLSLLRTKK